MKNYFQLFNAVVIMELDVQKYIYLYKKIKK
jgi:hypothetical protein